MSYLIHLIFRIDSHTPKSEPQFQKKPIVNNEGLLDAEPKCLDDDWDHLWTDLGGEG
jgi:hypothetical protein